MTDTKKKFTPSTDVFKSLSKDERDIIDSKKRCTLYKKGEIVYREGGRINGIYIVEKGVLKIYKTGIDEKPQIVSFASTGNIIGYRSVLSNENACTTVEALENSNICFIPSDLIFTLIKTNPDFALSLIQLTCKELDNANSLITDLAQKTVKERLAEIILMLHDTFGTDAEGFICVSLTREDLSSIVGTATESVIRILSDIKNDKLIELKGKKIRVCDYKRLKLISDSIF